MTLTNPEVRYHLQKRSEVLKLCSEDGDEVDPIWECTDAYQPADYHQLRSRCIKKCPKGYELQGYFYEGHKTICKPWGWTQRRFKKCVAK